MKEILLDELGVKQFNNELSRLKDLSLTSATTGSEAYNAAIGDGWHDNFDFEESMRESRKIAKRIDKMTEEKENIKIIKDKNLGNDYINIGDTFEIELKYSENDIEKEIITLTGKYIPNTELKIKEVSLNSPLGKNTYHQKINTVGEYKVGDNVIQIKIIRKINEDDL
jgi:transcription elongation GreA/GreB family factor